MNNKLDLNDLTKLMNDFVQTKGWYNNDTKRKQTPKNIASSLIIESAEVLEHFQWNEEPENKQELEGELADVALYLLQLASICEIDLEKAILEKLKYNYTREWDEKIDEK